MPGFDRTGPRGEGSRTGRGLGKCNPKNSETDDQNDVNEFPRGNRNRFRNGGGWGFRSGRGRGRGRGNS